MKIEEEIKQINDKISELRDKRISLIQKHVKPFLDKAIHDINQFRIDCDFDFDVLGYFFDDIDEVYDIRLRIDDKEFKSRLKKKHQIIHVAHKSVNDEFANKKIMIMGAI